jgi:hypothetical protein
METCILGLVFFRSGLISLTESKSSRTSRTFPLGCHANRLDLRDIALYLRLPWSSVSRAFL